MMTARDLIRHALRELAVLPAGAEPTADELADGMDALGGMLRSWQAFTNEWRRSSDTLILAAGVANVALPSTIRTVSDARLVQGAIERPLAVWDGDEYDLIPNKAQTGTPLAVSPLRERDAVVLSIWPVPASSMLLKIKFQRRFEAATDPAEELDVPEEWEETVWTNLALRLSGTFQAQPSPELVARAQGLLSALRDDDRPQSYFLAADA